MSERKSEIPPSLVMLFVVLVWATTPLFLHQFYREGICVWDQNSWRYVFVVFLLWLTIWFKYIRGSREKRKIFSLQNWLWAFIAALPCSVAQIFFVWSLKYLEPPLMGILNKQFVLWTALLGMLFFADERVLIKSGRFWLGFLGTISGAIGVVVFQPQARFHGELPGIIFVTIFGFAWSVYGVCLKRLTRRLDPLVAYGMVATYTAVIMWCFSLTLGRPADVLTQPAGIWLMLIASAVFNLFLPHIGIYWVIPRLGILATHTATLSTAFLTAFYSWLIFSQKLSGRQWICGIILIAGAALTMLARRGNRETLPPDTKA